MRIGKHRHSVTLEWWGREPRKWKEDGWWHSRTDSGATPDEWVPGITVWAEVEQLRGRTLFAAQEAHSNTTVRIRMRWSPEVAEATGKTLRLRHGAQVYRIEGRPIDLAGRRRELEIMCHEWV
ncbi:phage head closure protein [uncultured Halomonas sp.]|uniref:phage head closure protein n=1 Tax=uncultured Halomonas sp. TaxID=173971 RepID=UPI00260AE19B|nr:phage head closure protein [uncultured Halomonas sp.]